MIQNLSKKHEIILFALNENKFNKENIKELKRYCSHIIVHHISKFTIALNVLRALIKGIPLQTGYFYSYNAQKKVNNLIRDYKPDHIFCQLIRTAEYVKKHSSIPKTLDYMDAFSKGMERRSAGSSFYLRPFFNLEVRRLLKYEAKVFNYFKNRIIISEQDKQLIPHPEKEKIHVIPNGVDIKYFKPLTIKKEYDILFNGNMSYPPNIESAEYLINQIIPLVKIKYPGIKVLISGTDPARRILKLKSENVHISGWVDDIRENFAKSKMLLAPMQSSIGLQNKLLEAMAMQIPCITSTLSNNALKAASGFEILIADEPELYAQHIFTILEDSDKARTLTLNAYNFILKNYNWEIITGKLDNIIRSN